MRKEVREAMPRKQRSLDLNYKQRQQQALELRIEGYSQAEIAARVGCDPSTVSRMIRRALKAREEQSVDELRQIESERLETIHKLAWGYAQQGDMRAAAVLTRLMDRRAKLLGLDTPMGDADGAEGIVQYSAMAMIFASDEAEEALAHAEQDATRALIEYDGRPLPPREPDPKDYLKTRTVLEATEALPTPPNGITGKETYEAANALLEQQVSDLVPVTVVDGEVRRPRLYMKTIVLARGPYRPLNG